MKENRNIACEGKGSLALESNDVRDSDPATENNGDTQLADSEVKSQTITLDLVRLAKLDETTDWRTMWNPRMSMSFTSTKGLLNGPGDNNCFLNSAVQVLWHLDVFRRNFRMLSGHECMGASCIFCALKVIFTQFQYSDQPSLPPDALRKALAKAFAERQRFQIGVMDDAAECFVGELFMDGMILSKVMYGDIMGDPTLEYIYVAESDRRARNSRQENILMQIHSHIASQESEDMCQAKHCISHQKFAMTIVEQTVCMCGATSEPLPFSQMVHYVSASALVKEGRGIKPGGEHNFGALLKIAGNQGDLRNCPSGNKCGKIVQTRRSLMNQPDVVSIGLIWDSDQPNLDYIRELVKCIGTTLKLRELYHSVVDQRWAEDTTLHLVGVVCYYGKHYSTFFFHSKRKEWISFDDACVKEMGSQWITVADKCCRGHYQPLLLLYANPNAPALNTVTAPQKTTKVTDPRLFTEESFHASMSRRHNNNSIHYEQGQQQHPPQNMHFESTVSREIPSAPPAAATATATTSTSNRYRRSMTPSTEIGHSQESTEMPARRAVTPGPEWGKYHSDDELDGAAPRHMDSNIAHFRQPSYLSAMDTVGLPNAAAPPGEYGHNYREPLYGGAASAAARTAALYVNQTNSSTANAQAVDLLGPLPGHLRGYAANGNNRQNGQPPGAAHVQNGQPAHMSNGHYQGVSQVQSAHPSSVSQQQNTQPSSVSQLQSAHPSSANQLQSAHPSSVSQQQNTHQSSVSQLQSVHPSSVSQQQNTRPSSVSQQQNVHHQPGAGPMPNEHPSSTNPYQARRPDQYQQPTGYAMPCVKDFPDPRTIDSGRYRPVNSDAPSKGYGTQPPRDLTYNSIQEDGALDSLPSSTNTLKRTQSMDELEATMAPPSHHMPPPVSRTRPHSARPFDYANGRPTVDPFTGRVLKTKPVVSAAPKQESNTKWDQPPTEAELYGTATYINRKAVEKIMNKQKARPRTSSTADTNSLSSQSHHSSNSSIDSCSDPKKAFDVPILKVDIPDNVSLGSQRDSGYRSGESSGDRSSSSSGTSMESPGVDSGSGSGSIRSYHPIVCKALFHGAGVNTDRHSRSSAENMAASRQQGYNGVKTQPLGHIPENLPATTPGVAGEDNFKMAVDKGGNINTRRGTEFSQPDEHCQRLCMQAEELMQLSATKEQQLDLAMALVHCTQALAQLQEALGLAGTSQETKVFARMKHNTCILRSRSLHRHIMKRQESSQSTNSGDISNEDSPSLSSTDTESRDIRDPDLIQLETADKDRMQDFKDKLDRLYDHKDPVPKQQQQQQQHVYCATAQSDRVPKTGMTKSATDSALSGYCKPVKAPKPKPKPPARTSSITEESRPCASGADGNQGQSYGTLPKSKPKCSEEKQAEVYDAYLQNQKQATAQAASEKSSQPPPAPHPVEPVHTRNSSQSGASQNADCCHGNSGSQGNSLVNHARQWSKDEIRNMLVSDFYKRQAGAPESKNPVHTDQCIAKNDDIVKRRQLMYEEVLCRQVKQMNAKDVPSSNQAAGASRRQLPQVPLQNRPTSAPPVRNPSAVPPREDGPPAYHDVIKQRPTQPVVQRALSQPSGPAPKQVLGPRPSDPTPLAAKPRAVTSRPSDPFPVAKLHPHVTTRRGGEYEQPQAPFPGSRVQAAQAALLQNFGKPSVVGKLDKLDAQQRALLESQQQWQAANTQETSDSSSYWQNAPQQHQLRKTSSQGQLPSYANRDEEFWGSGTAVVDDRSKECPSPALTEEFPPPPPPICEADFPEAAEPEPPVYTQQQQQQHPSCQLTSGRYNVQAAACVQNAAAKPCLSSFQQLEHTDKIEPGSGKPVAIPVPLPLLPPNCNMTPTKSSLSKKKKKKGRKSRKSVTFSDNIALIVEKDDVVGTGVDYMAYVSQILSKKPPPPLPPSVAPSSGGNLPPVASQRPTGYDSDFDDDTSDSGSSTEQTNNERVRCSLCRKKLIEATSVYCEDCSFYMSKFQPLCS